MTTTPQPPSVLPATPPAPVQGLPNSDLDRARRFAKFLDGDARFINEFNQWAVWDGEAWKLDPSGKNGHSIFQKAAEFADVLMDEANNYPAGPLQVAAQALARRAFSRDVATAMIGWLKSQADIVAHPWDFDSNPWLLGTQNGVIDLKTNAFRAVARDDMVVKTCSVAYNPKAVCPGWREFLEQVLPDKEVRDFAQRAIGYSLTGMTTEQILIFFHGNGQNGKSTFVKLIERLLADYHWHTNASLFLESKSDENKDNAMANLPEKRFVVGAELPQQCRLAENRIKDLTGGDTIYARKLYCEAFNFVPTHKLFLYGNHKPIIGGTDDGIWRRILLVPFEIHVADDKRDRNIDARLWTEAEGVLNWALEGCRLWQKHGLKPPPAVISATREYQQAEDFVEQFVNMEMVMTGEIESGVLSANFVEWMKSRGFKWTASPRSVSERIKRLPSVGQRKSHGVIYWTGLSMKDAVSYRQ